MAPSLYYLAHGRRCAASTSGSTGNPPASLLPRSSPSLGSSAEERTVAELAALVPLALLVVLALGFAAGGWVCAFLTRCADHGDAVVLAAPVAAVIGCSVVARGAKALALLRRRRGAERLA